MSRARVVVIVALVCVCAWFALDAARDARKAPTSAEAPKLSSTASTAELSEPIVELSSDAAEADEGSPSTHVESERASIAPSATVASVTCRLLDESGRAFARQWLKCPVSLGVAGRRRSLTTDADGRLAWTIDPALPPNIARHIVLTFAAYEDVVLDFRGDLALGETHLPDVTLRLKPLLAAGRVVDAQGRPITTELAMTHANPAFVHVERWVDDPDHTGAGVWVVVEELETRTREDGTFRVSGESSAERLALRATWIHDVAAERVEFAPGATDLVLRVVDAGEIAIEMQTTLDIDLAQFGAKLVLAGASEQARHRSIFAQVKCDAHGRVRVIGLMPGVWSLSLGPPFAPRLVVVDHVEVKSGERADVGIDLDGWIERVRIEVVDEHGARIADARVSTDVALERGRTPARVEPGVFEHFVPATGATMSVRCDGYRGVGLSQVRSDQRVVLEANASAPVSVRVRARGSETLERDGVKLGVQFELVGSDAQGASARGRMFGGTFDAGREFVAAAPVDGPYRAWWTVEMQRGTAWSVRAVSLPSTERFVIERGKDGAVIELVVPPGLLDDAVLSVKERDESATTKTPSVKIEPPRRG